MTNGISWSLSMMQQCTSNRLSVGNMWCTGNLRPHTHFKVKRITEYISTTFRSTGESSGSDKSIVTTDHALSICHSHLPILSAKAILIGVSARIRDTDLRIRHNAATFARIWSKFRCTAECSAYGFSHVMTAPVQHICQSHLPLRHSRRYWVLWWQYETRLADSLQGCRYCCHMIEAQAHRKGFCSYPYNQSITAYLPIPVEIKSVWAILRTFVGIWDTGSLIHRKGAAFDSIWWKFWCTGESWA